MRNKSLILKYKLHHVLFWIGVAALWYFLRYEEYRNQKLAFWVSLIKTADLALLVYITNGWLIPSFFYKKKYGWFILSFLLLVVAGSLIKLRILGEVLQVPAYYQWGNDSKERIYDNVIPHFFLVLAGAAVKVMYDYSRMQRRMTEMAKEKAEAELNFLKSQINPHFLFNSLNSVYFLISKENAEARNALHKFSDMLRYQLYEVNGTKIPVEKEVSYLRDYVDLQRLRQNEQDEVKFETDESLKGFAIEPLLLIPFVENAFKHLSHHGHSRNFIHISMHHQDENLQFTVINSKESGPVSARPGGIGLNNVKRRLELLYPGKHELSILDEEKTYTVRLTIKTGA